MKKYKCSVCGWIYDPAAGDPKHGIVPGTPFEELPADWHCPRCGAPKEKFRPMEDRPNHADHYRAESPHGAAYQRIALESGDVAGD